MTTRKLVKQLGALEAIKPRTEWKEKTRDILLSQIRAQGASQRQSSQILAGANAYVHDALHSAYRMTLGSLFERPLVLSGVLSVLVVGVVSVAVASQSSIPGDPLYTVKRTHEQLRVAIVSPEGRPSLQLELAEKRLQELDTLSNRPISDEQKATTAQALTLTAQQNISNANDELDQLKKEAPKKAVDVAVALVAHTNDAIANLDETQNKALAVIVEKKDSAGVSESEVAGHIDSVIQSLEERLARTEKVSAASLKDSARIERSSEARRNLEIARDYVDHKDFKVALDKISLSRTIISSLESEAASSEKKGDAESKSTVR